MATTNKTSGTKKSSPPRRKPLAVSVAQENDLDQIRLRLFEAERQKIELNLDVIVLDMVESYEKFLAEKFGRKPARNKVVEMLLEEPLKNNVEFQEWAEKEKNRADRNDANEDDAILANLNPITDKNRVAAT